MSDTDRTVRICTRYWRRTGVPRTAREEMRSELEAHLHAAEAEGKPVRSVVGEDLTVFAESWASEHRVLRASPPMWIRIGPMVLALVVAAALFGLSTVIPVSSVGETRVCCPERIVERTVETDPGARFFVQSLLIGAALAAASGVLILLGRRYLAAATLGAATVLCMFSPMTWIPGLILLASLGWTLWVFRQPAPARATAGVP